MLSSRPKLLSEVIRNMIEHQPDMAVVGEVIDPIELIFALRETPVDVVIITPHKANGDPRICVQLLKEHPLLKIVMLTGKNEAVFIYQKDFRKKHIEKPSKQMIIDIIREPVPPVKDL